MLLLSTPNNYNHNNLLNVIVMQLTSLHLYIRHIIFDPFSIHYDPSFHSVSLWYYNRYYRIFRRNIWWTNNNSWFILDTTCSNEIIYCYIFRLSSFSISLFNKKENNNNNIILYLDYIISIYLISLKITGDIHYRINTIGKNLILKQQIIQLRSLLYYWILLGIIILLNILLLLYNMIIFLDCWSN